MAKLDNKKILIFLMVLLSAANLFAVDFEKYNSTLMIIVTKADGTNYVCSSVVVTRKKLLTAAHCLDQAISIKVVKEHKLMSDNSFYRVLKYDVFPKYDKEKSNYLFDIGIIQLKNNLPRNINIPKLKELEDQSSDLVRVGFGKRNNINSRTVVFPINQYQIKENYIDSYDIYSFSGDSGGPIFQEKEENLYLVGIHSTKENYNSLNPKIDEVIKTWILKY